MMADIVNTLKTSHASKMRDIVGICDVDFYETLVLEKKMPLCILRRLCNEHVIQFLS